MAQCWERAKERNTFEILGSSQFIIKRGDYKNSVITPCYRQTQYARISIVI